MRLANEVLELVEHGARHAELGEVAHPGAAVEHAEHHALAVQGRRDRHAHVELAVGEPQADAAVLGQPPLRDVQPRHDLHAADDRGLVLARRVRDLLQHAVDAVPHAQPVRARLEMHIARPRPQRLEDQDVDELDYRGLVGEGAQIVDRLFFVGEHDEIAAAEVARLELGRRLRLGREDRSVDLGSRRLDEPHLALEGPAELVDHRRIERQARRDDQRATLGDREGQQTMLLEILGREPLGQRARGGGAQVGGRAGRRRRWRGRGCLGAQQRIGHGFRGGGGIMLSMPCFMFGNRSRSRCSSESACSSVYTT